MILRQISILWMCSWVVLAWATALAQPAITQPIPLADIQHYADYSPQLKKLIENAQALTQQNLTYLYGSSDPSKKGMDCSGTIYYLLKSSGAGNVPRSSSEMFLWLEKSGVLIKQSENFTADDLKPGDLLFWSGTYNIKREPPITHVMLYLGKNSKNQPLMFGASDGRTYQGKKMWGVSVFDFLLPKPGSKSKFEGYGCIPELTCTKI